MAKFMLLVLPFRICILTIVPNNLNKINPSADILQAVKSAVLRANKLSCWKNVCLVQSIAARWMLQRRRISSTFIIGINKAPVEKMSAHAWLLVGSKEIVSGANGYIPIMEY